MSGNRLSTLSVWWLRLGIKLERIRPEVDNHLWLVTFVDDELGYFDDETCRLEPIANPFGRKVLPMSPE